MAGARLGFLFGIFLVGAFVAVNRLRRRYADFFPMRNTMPTLRRTVFVVAPFA
jgi:hypothetical protein